MITYVIKSNILTIKMEQFHQYFNRKKSKILRVSKKYNYIWSFQKHIKIIWINKFDR